MTRYDELAALAEQELELVSAGALDRLPELHGRRHALVATLPAAPPAAARPALERAAALQAEVTKLLEQRLRATGAELGKLTRGRTAVRGYAAPEQRHAVDQAA